MSELEGGEGEPHATDDGAADAERPVGVALEPLPGEPDQNKICACRGDFTQSVDHSNQPAFVFEDRLCSAR